MLVRLLGTGLFCTLCGHLMVATATATEKVSLREQFLPGLEHHVSSRVKLSGQLLVPVEKDKPPKKVAMNGESAIEYDERLLPADGKVPEQKGFRVYRQIEFGRTIGDRTQEMNLRPEVRKIVVTRVGRVKNFFSPTGPLTWGEIDLLRTDLLTPALAGLLPTDPVGPGDSWKATEAAILELTDLEKVESGSLDCRFEELTTVAGRQVARVRLQGTLSGVNEDGPNRQVLNGTLYFDMATRSITYLSIKGEHELLDAEGKTAGHVEGLFVMTRSLNPRSRELTDASLSGLALDPTPDNTLLLYDNPDLGLKFLYPRRWRVGRVNGPQVTLDDPEGNGILLTAEPLKRVPAADDFVRETNGYLTRQKATVRAFDRPARLAEPPNQVDRFAFGIEVNGQKVTMDYYIARQANGGVTVAARLLDKDRDNVRREVERLARSLTVTRDLNSR